MRALFCCAVALVVTAVPVGAQVCTGLAPFGSRYRLTGDAQFTDGAQAFGGGVGAASTAGLFGEVGLGAVTYDDVDGTTLAVGGQAGWSVPIGVARTVEVCPLAGVTFGFGPNDIEGSGVDMSGQDYTVGGSIGALVSASPSLQLVPAAGVVFAHTRVKLEADGLGSETISDSYGIAMFGLGFVLNRTVTIQPNVSVPFGLEDGDASYGISFALHLGNR